MFTKEMTVEADEIIQKVFTEAEQNSGKTKDEVLKIAQEKNSKSVELVALFRRECSQILYLTLSQRNYDEKSAINDYLQEGFLAAKGVLAKDGLKPSSTYMMNSAFKLLSAHLFTYDFYKKTEDDMKLFNELSFYIDERNVLASEVIDFNPEGVEDKKYFIVEENGDVRIALSYHGVVGWATQHDLEETIREEEEKLQKAKGMLNKFLHNKNKRIAP